MKPTRIHALLIILWLASFVLCLLVPLIYRRDIPASFAGLIKQTFDTFGPGLATMVAFLFARPAVSNASPRRRKKSLVDWLALALAIVYVGFFNTLMLLFAAGQARADETVQLFQDYRPFISFLVTGMLVYYFGTTHRSE